MYSPIRIIILYLKNEEAFWQKVSLPHTDKSLSIMIIWNCVLMLLQNMYLMKPYLSNQHPHSLLMILHEYIFLHFTALSVNCNVHRLSHLFVCFSFQRITHLGYRGMIHNGFPFWTKEIFWTTFLNDPILSTIVHATMKSSKCNVSTQINLCKIQEQLTNLDIIFLCTLFKRKIESLIVNLKSREI